MTATVHRAKSASAAILLVDALEQNARAAASVRLVFVAGLRLRVAQLSESIGVLGRPMSARGVVKEGRSVRWISRGSRGVLGAYVKSRGEQPDPGCAVIVI